MNSHQIKQLQNSIPALVKEGPQLTDHFYHRMFAHNPELKHIFNLNHQQSGKQSKALFNAIAAYVTNINDPAKLSSVIERIAHKHKSLDVQPEQYPIVGHHLIETLRECLGTAFTDDIENAWKSAYQLLSDIFIKKEQQLYNESTQTEGGWNGTRTFKVIMKEKESRLVTSLYFEPKDKKAIMPYRPGQYIGIKVTIPGNPYTQIRQYSLSKAFDGFSYRISVKREGDGSIDSVSQYLSDAVSVGSEIELLSPSGDFYLEHRNVPITLISAGVGITPMQAILNTLSKLQYSQPITYLHACESAEEHSFIDSVPTTRDVLNITAHYWYQSVDKKIENIHPGFMQLDAVKSDLNLDRGDFYLCGPIPFMAHVKKQLNGLHIPNNRIFYEVFGPHEDLN